MRKINIKNSLLIVGMVGLLFTACEDGDKVIDSIFEDEQRGAALRTIDVLSNAININSATNVLADDDTFNVVLEFQDQEQGTLLQDIDIFLSFVDNTDDDLDGDDDTEDDDENDKAEIAIGTISASEFTTGPNGLPRFEYSITAGEMTSLLGLDDSEIGFGGEQFVHRFSANLTDGRTFSAADNSGTLTGSYFSSPWSYPATVVCAPSVPTAGTWEVTTVDSFGDGWNGGELVIVLDGDADNAITIVNTDGDVPGGTEVVQDYTFEVPAGTETISITYTAGDFDEEVTFTVTSANGTEVIDAGPTPTSGSELLDFCPDNL